MVRKVIKGGDITCRLHLPLTAHLLKWALFLCFVLFCFACFLDYMSAVGMWSDMSWSSTTQKRESKGKNMSSWIIGELIVHYLTPRSGCYFLGAWGSSPRTFINTLTIRLRGSSIHYTKYHIQSISLFCSR